MRAENTVKEAIQVWRGRPVQVPDIAIQHFALCDGPRRVHLPAAIDGDIAPLLPAKEPQLSPKPPSEHPSPAKPRNVQWASAAPTSRTETSLTPAARAFTL